MNNDIVQAMAQAKYIANVATMSVDNVRRRGVARKVMKEVRLYELVLAAKLNVAYLPVDTIPDMTWL